MGRERLMRQQRLEREARKKGHKTKAAIAKYIKGKEDKTGTTWTNRSGTIIQADEGRNKGRMFKERAGDKIGKTRRNQKIRETILKQGKKTKRGLLSIIKGAASSYSGAKKYMY
tara:strand:+ start:343 stop:684 length:342 start_codon:yes stop_codon:yes gene_type:complete